MILGSRGMGFTEMKRKNAYIVLAEIVSTFLRAFLLKIECLPSVVLWLKGFRRLVSQYSNNMYIT